MLHDCPGRVEGGSCGSGAGGATEGGGGAVGGGEGVEGVTL